MLWWKLQQLKSSSWEKRAEAAANLGAAHEYKSVSELIKALGDDHAAVRLAVIRALAALAHPGSAEPLASAMEALSRHRKESRAHHEDEEFEAISAALGSLKDAAVYPLLRLLESEDKEARRWAAHALGLAGDPRAVAPLAKRLSDNRSDARKASALALGAIRDIGALDALIQALAHRDPETRRAAAIALGAIGSDKAVGPLCSVAEDPNEPVQLAVVEALGKIGGFSAAAGLRTVIDGGKKHVRDAAEAALNSLSLKPESAEERAAAAVLMGNFKAAAEEGDAARVALISAMNSRDPSRRQQAIEALQPLHSPQVVEPLQRALKDPNSAVRETALKVLVSLGPASVSGLIELISNYDPTVQSLAVRALGEIGDPRSAVPLAAMIEENEVVPNEYRDILESVCAAASALAAMLAKSPDAIGVDGLKRLACLPDSRLQFSSKADVDCLPVRSLALQELQRRGL
jgi:HEAT repeat protein